MTEEKRKTLRWHPAFYAGIQIEFRGEADCLEFIQEHTLGTEPVRTDMLIIKKSGSRPLQKNIGRIFRTYNVIEYKSPNDSLSIDAFYKAYGYANFYKSLTGGPDQVKITEVTLTLVCSHYPRKLIRHLREIRGYQTSPVFPGIYEVTGDIIPIQILVTTKLAEEENLWLRNLTTHITGADSISHLLADYGSHKTNPLYRTVMDIIVRANQKVFKEVQPEMCDALMELMRDELKDEFDKIRADAHTAGETLGMQEGLAAGRREGLSIGRREGQVRERQEGIKALIETCRDLNASKENTASQLMVRYSMDQKSARECVEKYWG